MTDDQILLHEEVTALIDTVQQYNRLIERMDPGYPGYVQAVIHQIRMENQLKELLLTCKDVL